MMFLFAIVWTTDIVAYFLGRLIGGPKLLPRVSPKKTWSGAIGGLDRGRAGRDRGRRGGGTFRPDLAIAVVAAILSVVAQAGDLFESH